MVKYAFNTFPYFSLEDSVFSYGDNVIAPLKIHKSELKEEGAYDKLLLKIKT